MRHLTPNTTFSKADVSAASIGNGNSFTLVFDVANTTASPGDIFAWQFTGVPGVDDPWANMLQDRNSNNTLGLGRGYVGVSSPHGDNRDESTYVVAVPEPSTALLGGLGLLALLRRRR